MSLNDVAQWLGYGVMLVGGVTVLALLVFLIAWCLAAFYNRGLTALIKLYGLQTLRKTMRQLEVDGKVSRQTGVRP